jgi:hypothetical protein
MNKTTDLEIQTLIDRLSLTEMFNKARLEGLLFWSTYQGFTLMPDELMAHIRNGKFRWGAANWKLVSPQFLLDEADLRIEVATHERAELAARLAKNT